MTLDSCEFIDMKISTNLNGVILIRLQMRFFDSVGTGSGFRGNQVAYIDKAVPTSKTLHESFDSVEHQLRNIKNKRVRFTFAGTQIRIRNRSTYSHSTSQYFQRIFIEYCHT